MACSALDTAMQVALQFNCTLAELSSRMSPAEYMLWVARLDVHPATSPDRWYADILAAILKRPSGDQLLPLHQRITHLQARASVVADKAKSNMKAMWSQLKTLLLGGSDVK